MFFFDVVIFVVKVRLIFHQNFSPNAIIIVEGRRLLLKLPDLFGDCGILLLFFIAPSFSRALNSFAVYV